MADEPSEKKITQKVREALAKVLGAAKQSPSWTFLKIIIGLVIIGVIGFLVFATNLYSNFLAPLIQQYIGIPLFIKPLPGVGVPLTQTPKYYWCVVENSWLGSLIKLAGQGISTGGIPEAKSNPFAYCQQKLRVVTAQDIGCTNGQGQDCYYLTSTVTNSKIVALDDDAGIVKINVRHADPQFCRTIEGSRVCIDLPKAKNVEVGLVVDSVEAKLQEGRCVVGGEWDKEKCNELDPTISPFTVTAVFTASCEKTLLQPKATLKYDYETSGTAPVFIRKEDSAFRPTISITPITNPGPIKIDIIPDVYPDPGAYTIDQDTTAGIIITFRNEGSGIARIGDITLEQIPPTGSPPLSLRKSSDGKYACFGPNIDRENIGYETSMGKVTIPNSINLGISQTGQLGGLSVRSQSIECRFEIPTGLTQPTQYIINGKAPYTYLYRTNTPAIEVNTQACTGITGTQWKFTQTQGGQIPPTQLSISGEVDWKSKDYDDSAWRTINPPDTNFPCTNCDKFYRKSLFWNGNTEETIKVKSDDGSACYINGKELWSQLGDEHTLGGSKGCQEDDKFDYCKKLDKNELERGLNTLACQVHNKGGPGGFDFQQVSKSLETPTTETTTSEKK